MARIRSIHPGVYTDEAWASVSIAARWFAKGICTEADDNGVFDWKPLQLKMRIFPADAVDIPELLAELQAADIVRAFTIEGKQYGAVRNFCRHQRPRKPKAWFPINEVVRAYVGSHASGDGEAYDEAYEVPQKSALAPIEATPVPPLSEIAPQMEDGGGVRKGKRKDADASSVRQTDLSPDFLKAWDAYPTLGRERSWSKDKTLPIWRDAAKRAGGEPRLLAAARRYVRLDKTHKGDAGPPGFHRWLKDGRWEHWLEGEVSAAVPLHTFAGADLRALLLKERGESWVRAWLDPADWEPDEQTILPRNGVAAAKLRQEVGPMLKRMGIHIRERAAA